MLPVVESDADWNRVVPDETLLRPGVLALCARLGLPGIEPVRFTEGTQPVYAVGDAHVLKLFPPPAAEDGIRESRVLAHLDGRLPVATPAPHASGEAGNGWRYLLMARLPGEDLAVAWPRLAAADRDGLVDAAGPLLAALHAVDPAPLADVLGPGDWGAFVARQRAGAAERQRRRGLPPQWCEQIGPFLDSAAPATGSAAQPVLLHTEFMRQHLLVAPDPCRLSGLLDFEPAMIGDPAYDFGGVGLFVTRGDPRLMRRFTQAYGHAVDPATAMAYTLLHVYSNMPWYLRELPPPAGVRDLASLAACWFGGA